MSQRRSGHIVKTFTTRTGKRAILRYPRWDDLDQSLTYVNALSQEDTFLSLSGETFMRKERQNVLGRQLNNVAMRNGATIFCFIDDQLVGTVNVYRNVFSRKRSKHVGILEVSVAREFRGDGIGYTLTSAALEESKRHIRGLRMIMLRVYEKNNVAIALYKKLGFTETGRIPKGVFYKEEYIDEIIMCKSI